MGSERPETVAEHILERGTFDRELLSSRDTWERLGAGSFGKVYRASLLGADVAVKCQKTSQKPNRRAALLREIYYLSVFPGPHVVPYYGSFVEDGTPHVVMAYVRHTLRDPMTVRVVSLEEVLAGVLRALCQLHAAGHIHRDVKARNVLVAADLRTAMLADFGLARPLHAEGRPMSPGIGPRKYRAPEVDAGLQYDTACDIYSFGVMVREVLGLRACGDRGNCGSPGSDQALRSLSEWCAQRDSAMRPTAFEALARLCVRLERPLPTRASEQEDKEQRCTGARSVSPPRARRKRPKVLRAFLSEEIVTDAPAACATSAPPSVRSPETTAYGGNIMAQPLTSAGQKRRRTPEEVDGEFPEAVALSVRQTPRSPG